ncbi:MAG: DUF924 family protein [Pseudomonadota bacterium]
MPAISPPFLPKQVLDLWYPNTDFTKNREAYSAWVQERMQGGMDEVICEQYQELTVSAARGELDHWSETATGRLALLLAIDQFSRSLWRDTPAAFGQDIKAAMLVIEGVGNGHYSQLKPWEQVFFIVALGHCEGPDHLARFDLIDRMTEELITKLPAQLFFSADLLRAQNKRVREVITRFGRHPHRNPIYGRISTPDEEAYIAAGDFPHVSQEAKGG